MNSTTTANPQDYGYSPNNARSSTSAVSWGAIVAGAAAAAALSLILLILGMGLIEQIEGVEPDGEAFDAKVKVLSEYVKHHVKEEHAEMFTKAKTESLDLEELGALMVERKADLLAERN